MQSVDPLCGYEPQAVRRDPFLNQRDRHDQVVLVESPKLVRHTQDSAGSAIQRRFVDQVKYLRQLSGRRSHFLNLNGDLASLSR